MQIPPISVIINYTIIFVENQGAFVILLDNDGLLLNFIKHNRIELSYTQSELFDVILAAATRKQLFDDMVKWVIKHQE